MLCADVSEYSVCSIFVSGVSRKDNQDEVYPSNLVPVILPACTICEDGAECSETSAHKIQTPGNRPKERIQHSEQGESLKSRKLNPAVYAKHKRVDRCPKNKRFY